MALNRSSPAQMHAAVHKCMQQSSTDNSCCVPGCLQALALCQAGAFDHADTLLTALGCTIRLANAVWREASRSHCTPSTLHTGSGTKAVGPADKGCTGLCQALLHDDICMQTDLHGMRPAAQVPVAKRTCMGPSYPQSGPVNLIEAHAADVNETSPMLVPVTQAGTVTGQGNSSPPNSPADSAALQQRPGVFVHSSLCNTQLLAGLQQAFAPGSCFWRQHAYDEPTTPYFSYVFQLVRSRMCINW